MGRLFGISKVTKNPFVNSGDYTTYQNGGGKVVTTAVMENYINTNSQLATCIDAFAQVASGADLKWYKEDSKGKRKLFNFKQIDKFKMNDYQSTQDWVRMALGTLELHKELFIVPEASSAPYRQGMIDFFIAPHGRYEVITGTNQSIESIKYKSASGKDTIYTHAEVIYIPLSNTSNNFFYGASKVKILNDNIQRIMKLNAFTDDYLQSGGKKSAIIGYSDIMSDDMQQEIKREVDNFVKNATKKTLMLNTESLNVTPLSGDITSTKVIEFLSDLNAQILQSFKMPKYLIGDYPTSVNADVVQQAVRLWFEVALKPLFRTIESHLTSYCRNVLGIKNLVAVFDYEGISFLEGSATEKHSISTGLNKQGLITINEARVMNGFEPLDFELANELIAPAYLTSSMPVRYSQYEQDVMRNAGLTTPTDTPVNGDGGADNTPTN